MKTISAPAATAALSRLIPSWKASEPAFGPPNFLACRASVDDHKVRILAFLDRATDALNEDFQVHDVFPLELAAPLVKDLM
jgi:hypothetical protein